MHTMRQSGGMLLALLGLVAAMPSPPLRAQGTTLGTFRWQLQPYCNVLTLTLVQQGSQYHVDGTDDLCGASRMASVVGRAFFNPDGSVGFGLTTVSTTGAAPVHLDARIAVATVSGPWTDSAGNSGTFVFTPGPGVGGALRPIPSGGIAPGSITSVQLAAGAVTAAQLAPGAITTALIASAAAGFGSCPPGQYLRGLQGNGTVLCEPIGTTPVSTSIDTAGTVGVQSSVAIGTDGLPIISHNASGTGLRVTHCSNPACTTAISTTVDVAFVVGSWTSIAIGSDGLAVISHHDSTNGDLRVTHCNNVVCTVATSVTVDSVNDVGWHTSIAIGSDGLPIISHRDNTNGDLRVTHCGNVTCSSGTTSTSVDTANNVGTLSDIAIGADGLAVISHYDNTNGDLRVTHCNNVACTSATTVAADTANNVGNSSSIAIGVDGLPIISAYDVTNEDLRVTHCATIACSVTTATNIDTAGSVGSYSAIAIGSDGLPVVSYLDATPNHDVKVAHCSNVACTSATSTTADTFSVTGYYTSIAIGADGLPFISATDLANGDLRVTKCNSRTCQ